MNEIKKLSTMVRGTTAPGLPIPLSRKIFEHYPCLIRGPIEFAQESIL
jgi:hypothetical protein